jgi:hypothetical protein
VSPMLRNAGPPALLAIVCAIGAARAELSRNDLEVTAPAPTVAPHAVSLLDGLRVGDRVAGWTVIELAGPRERAIDIGFERDGQRFVVTIAPMGARPEHPAMQTDRYAIYYGHAVPADRAIPQGAVRAITAALSRRIAKHEADVPEI